MHKLDLVEASTISSWSMGSHCIMLVCVVPFSALIDVKDTK